MEARVALQLLSEELLLLPLPHEWAYCLGQLRNQLPLHSRVGWHEFLAGQLGLLQLNCFQAPILPTASRAAGLGGFFPLIYLSPGAGLSISSGQTGWHIIPTIALSLWKGRPL